MFRIENKISYHTSVSIFIIILLSYNTCEASSPVAVQLNPRKIHCLDQTSTDCYIVNTYLPKNIFRPVSANPMNVMTLQFESSVIPNITQEICNAFPNLRTMNAMKSMIEEIEEESFAGCVNLDFIDLSHNKISHLAPNTFNRNKALKTLSLHDNNLSVLDVHLFRNLPNLWRLVLSLNQLTEVPVSLFRDLKNLGELTLHHNRLIDLDAPQLVIFCPKLKTIHLRDNDFRCGRLKSILNVLKNANVNFWDYVDKLRPRNYTVEFFNRTECLDDETFQQVMQERRNLTLKIEMMEKELNVWKETVAHVKEESSGLSLLTIILSVCAVSLVIGGVIGYLVARRRRSRLVSRRLVTINDRDVIIGGDFVHDQL